MSEVPTEAVEAVVVATAQVATAMVAVVAAETARAAATGKSRTPCTCTARSFRWGYCYTMGSNARNLSPIGNHLCTLLVAVQEVADLVVMVAPAVVEVVEVAMVLAAREKVVAVVAVTALAQ